MSLPFLQKGAECRLELRIRLSGEKTIHIVSQAVVESVPPSTGEKSSERAEFLLSESAGKDFSFSEGVMRIMPEGGVCFLTGIFEKKGQVLIAEIRDFLSLQRRKHKRYPMNLPCHLARLSLQGVEIAEYDGETVNLSEEGALVRLSSCSEDFPLQELWKFKLPFPGEEVGEFFSRIVRIYRDFSETRLHLHFTFFSEAHQQKLRRFLLNPKTNKEGEG